MREISIALTRTSQLAARFRDIIDRVLSEFAVWWALGACPDWPSDSRGWPPSAPFGARWRFSTPRLVVVVFTSETTGTRWRALTTLRSVCGSRWEDARRRAVPSLSARPDCVLLSDVSRREGPGAET